MMDSSPELDEEDSSPSAAWASHQGAQEEGGHEAEDDGNAPAVEEGGHEDGGPGGPPAGQETLEEVNNAIPNVNTGVRKSSRKSKKSHNSLVWGRKPLLCIEFKCKKCCHRVQMQLCCLRTYMNTLSC